MADPKNIPPRDTTRDPRDPAATHVPGEERRDDLDRRHDKDANPDAITGTPGSHPVGTGLGAAGAGAAGAAIGAALGGPAAPVTTPVGAAIGAVVGAVAGGLAGKGIAEQINPTVEEAYWRDNYSDRPYVREDEDYELYQPAYRHGWECSGKYCDRDFDAAEADIRRDWESGPYADRMDWDQARQPARDAWDRSRDANRNPR